MFSFDLVLWKKILFITFFLTLCTLEALGFHSISDNQANKKHHHKHGLDSKQRTFLMKELALLNATRSKKLFLNSRHHNSPNAKDSVVFIPTSDSAVEVNKAPQEQKLTEGGVVATSGLHYHDQYRDR